MQVMKNHPMDAVVEAGFGLALAKLPSRAGIVTSCIRVQTYIYE